VGRSFRKPSPKRFAKRPAWCGIVPACRLWTTVKSNQRQRAYQIAKIIQPLPSRAELSNHHHTPSPRRAKWPLAAYDMDVPKSNAGVGARCGRSPPKRSVFPVVLKGRSCRHKTEAAGLSAETSRTQRSQAAAQEIAGPPTFLVEEMITGHKSRRST